MKKSTLLIGFLCFVCVGINAQTNVITVDTPDEFLDAIGSDRIIQLKGSTIYLPNEYRPGDYSQIVKEIKHGKNYSFYGDGWGFTIFGVNNLKIIGLGDKPVKVISGNDGYVIRFKNCNNITIENVEAGHGPEKFHFAGGVLYLTQSKNFTINNSIMFCSGITGPDRVMAYVGNGTVGIRAENVTGLKCNNSIIRNCTQSIMSLRNCIDFEFDSCQFSDNIENKNSLVNINDCINLEFDSCHFVNNKTRIIDFTADDKTSLPLFNVLKSTTVLIKDCIIENNSTLYFCNKASSIKMKNTKLENNTFKMGIYKED